MATTKRAAPAKKKAAAKAPPPKRKPAPKKKPVTKREPKPDVEPESDEESDEAAALWELCEEHTGRVVELEQTVFRAMTGREDPRLPDASTALRKGPSVQSGLVPAVYALYWRLSEAIDPALLAYFDELVRKGAEHPATDKRYVPGALCFLGVCMGRWSELDAYVRAHFGAEPTALDRYRRLELEVCARRLIEKHGELGGLPFLRTQIQRWTHTLEDGRSDETLSSLAFLLRRRDPETIQLINDRLSQVTPKGANWQALNSVAQFALYELRDDSILPALRAMAEQGLGRHDDGDRAIVLRALAACGASADDVVRAAKNKRDVREGCLRCAIAAAEIERAVTDESVAEAVSAIEALLAKSKGLGEMEFGACTSLLIALQSNEVRAMDALARRVLRAGEACKWADPRLLAWLQARVG